MKRQRIVLTIVLILAVLFSISFIIQTEEPILGESCGTVNPDNSDECCYMKFKDANNFPTCPTARIFYNLDKAQCDYECKEEPIFCTEEAMQCPNGSWTSRTSTLDCKFIPCGYD